MGPEGELLSQLSQFGILGVILALVLWIAIQLWRDLKKSWEARLLESQQMVQAIEATKTTYSSLSAAIESRARATEAVADAQMATARTLESQAEVLRRLEDSHRNVLTKLDQLGRDIHDVHKGSR